MRLSSLPWVLCVASSTIVAAAGTAKVLVLDSDVPSSPPSSETTVDPDTARLILAQRLELGQWHSVAGKDEEAIRQINAFGARQQGMFGMDRHTEDVSRLLVMVEGVDLDAEKELTKSISKDFRSFSISPAPHPEDSAQLFKTFTAEGHDAYTPQPDDYQRKTMLALINLNLPKAHEEFDYGHAMLRYSFTKSSDHASDMRLLAQDIADWQQLAEGGLFSLTIMFTPPSTGKASKTPFGLTKRDSKAQRQPAEKPLLSAHNVASPVSSDSSDSFLVPEPISPNLAAKPLRGPIPTCFPSLKTCQETTRNCTSHGSCILKYSRDSTSGDKVDCYGCACTKPEVRKNKDGSKKTTNFAGAACHKKDVVFPFWLLAGTTVGIIGVITFGLGMLYEMGSQELPSVIGAGVSGPKPGGGR